MINGIPSRKTCLEQVQAINDEECFLLHLLPKIFVELFQGFNG